MSNAESLTGQYMSGRLTVPSPEKRRLGNGKKLKLTGVRKNNLKDVDVELPLGCLICVTGVSGSGKSSLITEVLTPLLLNKLNGAEAEATGYQSVNGLEHLDKMIDIDQSPIGRTPRSNPATYVKVFDEIRDLYARLPESKKRGYAPVDSASIPPAEDAKLVRERLQSARHGNVGRPVDYLSGVQRSSL